MSFLVQSTLALVFAWGLLAPAAGAAPFTQADCNRALAALGKEPFVSVIAQLPPYAREFVTERLVPVLGGRTLYGAVDGPRTWTARPSGFRVSGFGPGQDINVSWVKQGQQPYFRIEPNGNRTLFIPNGFDFSALPDGGQGWLLRALRGHRLHPFSKSASAVAEREAIGEPSIVEKQVQKEGIEAFRHAMEQGDDTFLFVGPTGVGKTIVLQGMLADRIRAGLQAAPKDAPAGKRKPGVHIVFADQDPLVDQLHADVMKVEVDDPIDVFRWGGNKEEEGTPLTIEALTDRARTTGRPVVLVTTIQSLVGRVGKQGDADRPYNVALLEEYASTFFIDEAHHSGAPQTIALLDEVRGIQRDAQGHAQGPARGAKVVGLTATPRREDMNLIEHIFHGNAFWAYLDSAEQYKQSRGEADRPLTDILRQLEIALERGEAHPFRTWFLNPDRFSETGEDLFTKPPGRGSRFSVNPKHYDNFFEGIRPVVERNDHLFFATSSITEAERMAEDAQKRRFLRPDGTRHTVAVLHSGLTRAEKDKIKLDFEHGRVSMLFTVGMMDEGINVATLTAYIDTNQNTNPKELLQRMGRTLRLVEGKVKLSDIVSFQKVNDAETAEALLALDALSRRDWGEGNGHGTGEGPKTAAVEGGAADDPSTLAPRVLWTAKDIQTAKQEFFNSAYNNETAQANFDRILKHVRSKGGIDGLNDPSQRVAHNLLAEMMDSQGNVSNGFFMRVAENPLVSRHVSSFRKRRTEFLKNLESPEGIVAELIRFYKKNERLPGTVKGSNDENALRDAVLKHKASVEFLFEVGEHLPAKAQEALGLASAKARILEDDGALFEAVGAAHALSGVVPHAGQRGFERELGLALAQRLDSSETKLTGERLAELLEKHVRDEELQYEFLDRFEAAQAEGARRKQAEQQKEAERKAALASGRQAKPAEVDTALNRLERALASVDRAKAGLGPANKSVEVNISGVAVGTARMLTLYQDLAKSFGLSVSTEVLASDKTSTSYKLVLRASGTASVAPSDVMAFETGLHRLSYVDRGGTFTNDIRVEVVGIGDPPKPRDPPVRKYLLHTNTPSFSDSRVGGQPLRYRERDGFAAPFTDLFVQLLGRR